MEQAFVGGSQRTRIKLPVDSADDRVLAAHTACTDAPEIVQCLAVALAQVRRKVDVAMHPAAPRSAF